MGRYWLIAATMLLVPASLLRADEITIVSGGKSNFVIATRAKPSPAEDLAASQLESYLERMSGADVAVVRADGVKQPSISVVTSRQKSVENGFAIIRSGEHVIITGDSDATTLNGVYYFLDLLGCRFLAPQLDHY